MRSGINLFDINTKDTFFQEFADSKKIFETQKNLDRANIEYEMQRMGLELRQVYGRKLHLCKHFEAKKIML
jgi:hypothetical protein